ncbi:MAG: histidine phosphatase family protein [Pyrinomonadaceae bacterium]
MNKIIYLVRHSKASGQSGDASLTLEGRHQAEALAEFLSGIKAGRIVSSPFARALQSIEPLANRLNIEIKSDNRLVEAALSTIDYPDWLDKLRETFSDFELSFEGGESSQAATNRSVAAINDALQSGNEPTIVVTHGRLMTLILKYFNSNYGFEDWRNLTTPDVFRIAIEDDASQVDRIWRQ